MDADRGIRGRRARFCDPKSTCLLRKPIAVLQAVGKLQRDDPAGRGGVRDVASRESQTPDSQLSGHSASIDALLIL